MLSCQHKLIMTHAMSCYRPFRLKNINYDSTIPNPYFRKKYFIVPCGKCLNCITQRKTQIKHQAIYEAKKYNGLSCFVTLTYSPDSLINFGCYAKYPSGKIRPDKYGKPIPSLRFKDLQDFMKRLRINYFRRYGTKLNMSYLACGEYGDKNDRNHFHVLFFGLGIGDINLIQDSWRNPCSHPETKKDNFGLDLINGKPRLIGRVQVERPGDLSKCIGYIAKYMTKSIGTESVKHQYDEQGIERPKVVHSKSFGLDLYESQVSYIKNHNFCYRFEDRDYPVPYTVKMKLCGLSLPDNRYTIEKMRSRGYKDEQINDESIQAFKLGQAQIQHEKLLRQARERGEPQFDPDYSPTL